MMRYLVIATLVTGCIYDGHVTVTLSGAGSGMVTSDPPGLMCNGADPSTCRIALDSATVAELRATPQDDSTFAGWSGACDGTDTCFVDGSVESMVDARFDRPLTLTIETSGTGAFFVTSTPDGVSCSQGTCTYAFPAHATITLHARPAPGMTAFIGWSGACSGTGDCVVQLDTDVTVGAQFAQLFVVGVELTGSVVGHVVDLSGVIDCPTTCTHSFAEGSVVTLKALPAIQVAFAGWSGGGCGGTGDCTVTVGGYTSVSAAFAPKVTLQIAKAGNGVGTITSTPAGIDCGATCSKVVAQGTSYTLTAVAATDSTFTGWTGGGCSGTGTCDVTLAGSTTITATFTRPVTGYTTTTLAVGANPEEIALADFNNDGKLDLAVTNEQGGTLSIALGSGSGTFGTPSMIMVPSNPRDIAVGDLDNNGTQDLVTINTGGIVTPLLGTGSGTFNYAIQSSLGSVLEAVALGDLNGDGYLDAVVTDQANNVRVLLNTHTGRFQTDVSYAAGGTLPTGVAIGDVNGDGKLDVVTANYTGGTVSVLLGSGTGTLGTATTYATAASIAQSVAIGDLDGDGKLDLAVANFSSPTQSQVSILRGNGNGTFQTAVGYAVGVGAVNILVADTNIDGVLDVLVPDMYSNELSILRGNGDATFQPAIQLTPGTQPQGVAVGDLDGNGYPDIVVANGASNNVAILIAM